LDDVGRRKEVVQRRTTVFYLAGRYVQYAEFVIGLPNAQVVQSILSYLNVDEKTAERGVARAERTSPEFGRIPS
jgi:hypothetical protein